LNLELVQALAQPSDRPAQGIGSERYWYAWACIENSSA
jgi:hypothetical protein